MTAAYWVEDGGFDLQTKDWTVHARTTTGEHRTFTMRELEAEAQQRNPIGWPVLSCAAQDAAMMAIVREYIERGRA